MSESLRQKTARGFVWSAVQRLSAVLITFLANVLLARLLSPEDFGYVGMLMVFIAVSATLVDGGFGSALIQKHTPTAIDYSTVFFFNLTLSSTIYGVLFLAAPAVAAFYNLEQLGPMLRIMGLIVVADALSIVQTNQLRKRLDFRRLTAINVLPSIISTLLGVGLAVLGMGVWSLVARVLLNSMLRSGLCWFLCSWRPREGFRWSAFKELVSFGGLVFLGDTTETVVNQFVSLLIGRSYSARDLGYYTQASNLHNIPQTTIPFVVNQVLFPVFSSIQTDVATVRSALEKSMKGLAFLSFPLMVSLMLVAEPLIVILFSDKWLASVPYFQVLCFGGLVYTGNSCNVTVLTALGQGRTLLYLSLFKRGVTLLSILVGMEFGVIGIVCGWVISVYLWFPVNALCAGRLTGYGVLAQLGDVAPAYIVSLSVGVCVALGFSKVGIGSPYIVVGAELLAYFGLYLAVMAVVRTREFWEYLSLLTELAAGLGRRTRSEATS